MDNSVNKASVSLLALAALLLAAIAAKVRASIEAQAPEGYEDATGFHFGSPNFEDSAKEALFDDWDAVESPLGVLFGHSLSRFQTPHFAPLTGKICPFGF